MSSATTAAASASGSSNSDDNGTPMPRLLADPQRDPDHLSPAMCYLRQQIQIFAATEKDVEDRRRIGGTRDPPQVGRVGLRCFWCCGGGGSFKQAANNGTSNKGAVTYPKSLRIMHQAVRNFQRYHFFTCPVMPQHVRDEFKSKQAEKRQKSRRDGNDKTRRDGKEYWVQSCIDLGLVDGVDGIWLRSGGSDHDNLTGRSGPLVGAPGGPVAHFAVQSRPKEPSKARSQPSKAPCNTRDVAVEAAAVAATESVFADVTGIRHVGDGGKLSFEPLLSGIFGLGSAEIHAFAKSSAIQHESSPPPQQEQEHHHQANVASFSAAATGVKRPLNMPPSTSTPITDITDELIRYVNRALDLVAAIRESHEAGEGSGLPHLTKRPVLPTVSQALALVARGAALDSIENLCNMSVEARIRSDLVSLGRILFKELASLCVSSPTLARKKIRTMSGDNDEEVIDMNSLRRLGVPPSLCFMLAALGAGNPSAYASFVPTACRYLAAREVEEDLLFIKSHAARYLVFAVCSDISKDGVGKIDTNLFSLGTSGMGMGCTRTLCGRDDELEQLNAAYQRTCLRAGGGSFLSAPRSIGSSSLSSATRREIVLLSGYSGVGKSSIAEEFSKQVKAKGGDAISVKFDQQQPMSCLLQALNKHCRSIVEGDPIKLETIRSSLKTLMGSRNANVLSDAMPNFAELIGTHPSSFSNSDDELEQVKTTSNRFVWFLRLFVRGICITNPVVLILDDIHEADEAALDVACALASDPDNSSLLVVGSYRNTEIRANHILQDAFRDFASNDVNIVPIELKQLPKDSVNLLVSQTLAMSSASTQSLSAIIYAKTLGNALFVLQLLTALQDEGLLTYSSEGQCWLWNTETIKVRDIADNCVDLMTRKIRRLDEEMQIFLKKASCLGSEGLISNLTAGERGIKSFLLIEAAIEEGLMSRIGSEEFKFSHGLIHNAIYSDINEKERMEFHLSIGTELWKHSSVDDLETMVFTIVDQLARGESLITDHEERAEVAKLCVMAGEKAIRMSAFPSACSYFLQGSALLEEKDWKNTNYELSLRLFTSCAEAQLMTGNYAGSIITLNFILLHGKTLKDKMKAYVLLVENLGSQGKMREALKMGLSTLLMLGESLPLNPNQDEIMAKLKQARRMLVGSKLNDISQKETMTNIQKIWAVNLLMLISRYAYMCSQRLLLIIACHFVQLSSEYGLAPSSPYAFALFGSVLLKYDGLQTALHYGKISLALLARFDEKRMLSRCQTVLSDIFYFTEPAQARLQSQIMSIEVGLRAGDTESALTCANIFGFTALQTGGVPLERLSREMKRYMQQMTYTRHHSIHIARLLCACIKNLQMPGCGDPTDLSLREDQDPDGNSLPCDNGKELRTTQTERAAAHRKPPIVLYREYTLRLQLACFFHRYDAAKEIMKLRDELYLKMEMVTGDSQEVEQTFYTGISAAELVGAGNKEYSTRALAAIPKFEEWVRNGPHFQHRLALLNAEVSYHIEKDFKKASRLFDDAIRLAKEHLFLHEQALALELAGRFQRRAMIDYERSRDYFDLAKNRYQEWGAKRKAVDMVNAIEDLNIPTDLWF